MLQARATGLEEEVGLLRDELARASAVAARVAASEVRDFKGDGTVPIQQHLEEIKFMNGENRWDRAALMGCGAGQAARPLTLERPCIAAGCATRSLRLRSN